MHAFTNNKYIYFHVVAVSVYNALNLYSMTDFSIPCKVAVGRESCVVYEA